MAALLHSCRTTGCISRAPHRVVGLSKGLGQRRQSGSLQEGDRRDLNPRPSEPQSVAAFPSLFWCVSVCGLFRPKTRFWRTELPNTSWAVLTSTAATLLPLGEGRRTG